jgi:hypothetical protein
MIYYYLKTAPIDGWYANLITKEGVEGLPEIMAPETPYRVWSGQ